ncbi:MAG: OmpA family protein [Candidatus Competibacteraceae bacterium]|jgi:outer membrane protein OmpA-like peptidoglycan-associated protein|nr:OmpA family protein [Candidatus Competibacteraceae bacterium]
MKKRFLIRMLLHVCIAGVATTLGFVHAQTQQSIATISAALNLALSAEAEKPLPETVRLANLTGTYVGAARRWEFDFRDGETVHRVRVDSNGATKSSQRYDERGADPDYWSQIPTARQISGLDELLADATRRVSEAGFEPAGPMLVKYRVPGPRVPEKARQEKPEVFEVFFEIAGDDTARRVVFIDRQFDQLTHARLLKIQLPKISPPQANTPRIQVPEVRAPEIQAPTIQLPEITTAGISVQENDELAVITVATDILFDFDKADIRPDAEVALQQIAGVLQKRYADQQFTIHGHTDSKGSDSYNRALSQRRAGAVSTWLARNGIAAERAGIEAHGESQPVAPNENTDGSDNPTGRQQNRRVEIVVQRAQS